MNDSKCLLVLKTPQHLSKAQIESLTDLITPTAEALGAEPMVLGSGFEVELQTGSQALLERVCVALEALVAQGQPPEVSDAQIAPQALNARPTGLNSRAVEQIDHDRAHDSLGRWVRSLKDDQSGG
jgi:hypothetical protein